LSFTQANNLLSIGASLAFMVQSVSFFGMDAPMRMRELGAGLCPHAYFLGKATAALAPALCLPLLFYACVLGVLVFGGRHQHVFGRGHPRAHGTILVALVLACSSCQAVGVVLSLLVPPDKAYLGTVGLVVLFHALSGFQPPAENLFAFVVDLLLPLSYARHLLSIMLLAQEEVPEWRQEQGVSYYALRRATAKPFKCSCADFGKHFVALTYLSAASWFIAYVVFLSVGLKG
jgi:hypothetical protein